MFRSEGELDERLSSPSPALVADLARERGDLLVLGAGGKMGPTLCRLARQGLDAAGRGDDRVLAASRWSDRAAAAGLAESGVDVVSCDLLADDGLADLPDAPHVVFMVGAKFGTASRPELTWVLNAALPDRVARRFRHSRIVALSTGNVYPLVPVGSGGCAEDDGLGPVGEYAMSCLGRERVLAHAARERATPVAVLRLNYAVDLRYGVLADIGTAVRSGAAVDLTTGAVNVVWQGYANEVILRSLAHAGTEPFVLNLTGPETAAVQRVAQRFADRFGCGVAFVGEPAPTALLSDASRCHQLFGYPDVPLATLIDWQADWLTADLPMHGKPTRFAVRDGKF